MIFTIINTLLCAGLAFLCFISNRGRHTFYLGFIFCIYAVQEGRALEVVKPILVYAPVLWIPETLLLLVPPLLVCFVRSVFGFSNHLYTKFMLIPSGMYLKFFFYFYVAGYIRPESFYKSGFFYGGAFETVIYCFVTAAWLLVWIHKYRQLIGTASFYWLQGLLLFIIVYSTGVALTLGASYLNRIMAVHWLIEGGSMFVFFSALLINGLTILITPIQILAKDETPWDVTGATVSLNITTKKELDPKLREEYANRIKHALEVKKAYLNSKVTLSRLAKSIDMSPHNLSYVVNNEWGINFNELINSYRVNEAKLLLRDEKYDTATIFSIAIDSGFNSESSFYTVFKKITGKSPKRYRDTVKTTSER